MNAVECSSLQLLQQHHDEVKKQARLRKRKMPGRRGAQTDLCFSRMHIRVPGRREGDQPDSEHDRAPWQAQRHSRRLRLATGQPQRHGIGQDLE